jgi:hypothetical protein
VTDHKTFSLLYSKTVDKLFKQTMEVPREGSQFFAERTTNLDTYTEASVYDALGVPFKNEDNLASWRERNPAIDTTMKTLTNSAG